MKRRGRGSNLRSCSFKPFTEFTDKETRKKQLHENGTETIRSVSALQ